MQEHGLVASDYEVVPMHGGDELAYRELGQTRITARGLDFLADDGGLSAVLGVVTFRLHDDTVKEILEKHIVAAPLPARDKSELGDKLKALPADATKHLVLKLIDKGLEAAPAAWQTVQSALKNL